MPQIAVRLNAGNKFLVLLVGGDRALGKVECVVSLPRTLRMNGSETARKRAVIGRAIQLAEQFLLALQDAEISHLRGRPPAIAVDDARPLGTVSDVDFLDKGLRPASLRLAPRPLE